MKLANIIYEKELVNHTKVDYVNYFNEPKEYNKVDKTLPTLYVGWSFMKSCNSNNETIQNANILHKKIVGNKLYWECSFEESKSSHVKGVDKFVTLVPQFYFQPKYNYINLDPVFFQIVELQDLLDYLPKAINASYNYKNEMLYLLKDNKIWGINLLMFSFFKFNINEIKNSILERTTFSHDDIDGSIYQLNYKIFPNFQQLKRYMITII